MGDRVGIEIEDFIRFFEHHSGHRLEDLRSSLRRQTLVQARLELAKLAQPATGFAPRISRHIQKHPTSVARWISLALRKQLKNSSFRKRIDDLDRRISRSARNDV